MVDFTDPFKKPLDKGLGQHVADIAIAQIKLNIQLLQIMEGNSAVSVFTLQILKDMSEHTKMEEGFITLIDLMMIQEKKITKHIHDKSKMLEDGIKEKGWD